MALRNAFLLAFLISTSFSTGAFSQSEGQIGTPKKMEPDIVGAGGEFTTKVEITLPEFRGLPLGVSLNYNSSNISRSGVDNTVGMGWSLNAFSMIERKSLGGGVPTFDNGQDVYYMDGQELMACNDAAATNKLTTGAPLRYLTDQPSASCSSGGNYTSRVENYLRILYNSAANDFVVTRKDGTQLTYKSIAALVNNTSPFNSDAWRVGNRNRWLLTEIRDTQATPNIVTYAYDFGPASSAWPHRLKRIEYAEYRVEFAYREYSSVGASSPKYATGTAVMGVQPYQLRSIRVLDNTVKVRAYQISHQNSSLTKAQLVTKIQEFGSDFVTSGPDVTSGTAQPATEFTYSPDTVAFQEKSFPGTAFYAAATAADTDFDGRDELMMTGGAVTTRSGGGGGEHPPVPVYYPSGAWKFDAGRNITSLPSLDPAKCLSTGNAVPGRGNEEEWAGYYGPTWSPKSIELIGNDRSGDQPICLQHDYENYENHNGDSQRITYSMSTVNVNGSGSASIATETYVVSGGWGAYSSEPYRAFGNFDLDPDTELLGWSAIYDVSDAGSISGANAVTGGINFTEDEFRLVSDFTGDGVDDVVNGARFMRTLPENGYLGNTWRSRGSNIQTTLASGHVPYIRNWDPWQQSVSFSGSYEESPTPIDFLGYGDMDGNGIADVVFQKTNYRASDELIFFPGTGAGFGAPVTLPFSDISDASRSSSVYGNDKTTLRDINNDGLTDIILHLGYNKNNASFAQNSAATWVFINNGSGFTQVPINGSLTGFNGFVGTGDFDGDGLVDMVLESSSGMSFGSTVTFGAGRILFGNGGLPNRMVSVRNTAGGVLSIGYAPSSKFGTNQMPGVQQVVETLTRSDGRGGSDVTTYSYVGGKYDFINRRTLGYKTVTANLPAIAGETTGPTVVTTYLNNHIAEYGLVKSRVVTHDGTTYQRIINDYTVSTAGNGPYWAVKTSTRDAVLSGTVLAETTTTQTVNLYGEPLAVTEFGFTNNGVDISGDDNRTTTYAYAPNLTRYIVSKPTFKRVHTQANSASIPGTWLQAEYYDYDGLGNNTSPTNGNLTRVQEWTGDNMNLRTKATYTYDPRGNLLTETDARNQTTTHGYDTSKYLFRVLTTNALGHASSTAWNTGCQQPQSLTDINGLVTSFTYDPLCRETRRNLPTGAIQTTRYVSFGNAAAQYIETETPSASNIPGSTLSKTQDYFDGNGRSYKTAMPGSTSAATDSIITLQAYDARGNLAWQSLPLAASAATGTPSPNQRITFTYDPINRPLSTVQADGAKSTSEYVTTDTPATSTAIRQSDAHCSDAASANTICGQSVTYFDAYQRQVRETVSKGPTPQNTYYSYDLLGRLIKVKDPLNSEFIYTYDAYGNRLTANDPGLGVWTMAYDANGNLTQQTDAKGQVMTFTYDALNRPTEKRVSGGVDGLQINTMTYDEAVSGYFNKGQLTRQTRGDHEIRYDYHKNGQVARETQKIGTRSFVFSKTYTTSGALLNQTMPNQPNGQGMAWVGEYKYDAASRLTGLGSGPDATIKSITYNLRNQPLTSIYGNDAKDVAVYNAARGWMDRIGGYEKNKGWYFELQIYTRTATGRISRVDTAAKQGDLDYTYDYTGRLLTATNFSGQAAYNQSFTYDKSGRMLSNSRVGTYSYSSARPFHAPKSVNVSGQTFAFTYDANGNMTTGLDGKTMGYDGENRPLWVNLAGKRTCYVYAADGSRLKKVENLPANQNCAALPATAETTAYFGGAEIRKFGQGTAEQILTYPHPSVRLTNGVPSYLHLDQLGTVRGITGPDGNKDSRAIYRPFGEQEQQVYDATAPAETKGFLGERYDSDAGLQYLNARYYDPKLALFIQPDWFEVTKQGVGTNRYSYSFNDPINKFDPNGNSWLDRAWDSIAGEGSFNRTFGDKASAWSDRTFGNGGERVTGISYSGDAAKGTSYTNYKSKVLDKNQALSDAVDKDAIRRSSIDIEIALFAAGGARAGYAIIQKARSVALEKAALEASKRIGLDLSTVTIENGVAKGTIKFSENLLRKDLKAVTDFLKSQGASKGRLDSGYIANENLLKVLERGVGRGPQSHFGGGTVSRAPLGEVGDFIIEFTF